MIDPLTKLTVLHDDNSSFVDLSDDSADLTRDNYDLQLVSLEDYLYLGFSRPFSAAYVALVTSNTVSNTLSAEYWNGTAWTSLSLTDETKGFTRSGFLFWDRSLLSSTAIDGKTAYYIRLKPSADHSLSTLRGINLVFSDDAALKREFFEADNSSILPPGENSQLVHHVAARDTIVQRLRNEQYIKTDSSGTYVNLTQWDLFDVFEIRQASVMLTMAKLFFNLADSAEDQWWTKYREYQDRYEEAFRLARLSFDSDNDGVKDSNENLVKKQVYRWQR